MVQEGSSTVPLQMRESDLFSHANMMFKDALALAQ